MPHLISWFENIEWTSESVTAAGTIALACLTLVLAVGTLFLWLATRRLVRGSELTAERQLRAYLSGPTEATIERWGNKVPIYRLSFENSGQTPAHCVNIWTTSGVAIMPISARPQGPDVIEVGTSKGVIGPGAKFHVEAVPENPVSDAERLKIISEHLAFFVYGEISYKDAFGKKRLTTFCMFHYGERASLSEAPLATYDKWNEAT